MASSNVKANILLTMATPTYVHERGQVVIRLAMSQLQQV
uniref:Uncharacterized protein n=1 Tax=Amphimedon queenslandica TaxID=400682 RepID=A0A1X7VRV7_AMPQE